MAMVLFLAIHVGFVNRYTLFVVGLYKKVVSPLTYV